VTTLSGSWCIPRQVWLTRQRGGEQSDGRRWQRHVCLIFHMAVLAATHNYATSLERRHLISKYWLANCWLKTATYGRKKNPWIQTRTDSGRICGLVADSESVTTLVTVWTEDMTISLSFKLNINFLLFMHHGTVEAVINIEHMLTDA